MPMRFKDKIEGTITNADYAGSAGSVAWGNVTGKPTTFAPSSHTHNYAGSASAGGSANSAVKLDTATAGSTSQPVYFSGGKPVAIGYTILSNVPANAKFTDTNTTYDVFKAATASAAGGKGLVPAPAAGAQGKYLRADGTWQTPPDTNTTYPDFTGATADAAGAHGLVPAPAKGQQNYFLCGDKTWQALSKSSVGLGNVDNTADSAKSVKYATSAGSANSVAWGNVSGKPSTFTPSSHTHKYASGFSVSGTTVTVTYGDNTTSTFTTQDTNNTYSVFKAATASAAGGTGLVPAPAAGAQGKYLRADGTWQTPPDTNTTYNVFKAASATAAGDKGLVPAPAKGDQAKFLRADSTWATPANTWRGIQDNLTSTAADQSLSANQGKVLKGLVDGKAPASHTHKYASGFSVSGTTVTVTYGDNTTSTFTTQDTNTTYPDLKGATASAAGVHGLVPAPAAGAQTKYLRGDGTWQTPPDTNTTYNVFKGATASAAGDKGLVPAPGSGVTTQYLKSTGAWGAVAWSEVSGKPTTFTPASHTHNYAGSASAGGSATSAVKLDTATAGSATQPVYFSNGKPTACTYTLGKSVPSNAVFTDTHTLSLADRVSGTVVTCDAIPTT